jgi:hypothetical protein
MAWAVIDGISDRVHANTIPNPTASMRRLTIMPALYALGNPLQSRAQIFLHSAHDLARQLVQVDSFAEFRRNDQFPEPRVAILLPAIQDFRRRDGLAPITKGATRTALGRALASDVPDVCSPLASDSVWREHHADRVALLERPPTTSRFPQRTAVLPPWGVSGESKGRPHSW